MVGKKGQVATEYLIITAFILIVVTVVFVYSFISNNQNIKINQANNALDKLVNKADLVYALGPDNNQFVDITLPTDVQSLQDVTICNNLEQGHNIDCFARGGVKRGGIEMQFSLTGGVSKIARASKAEIELDIPYDEVCDGGAGGNECDSPVDAHPKLLVLTEGKQIVKVYWCGEKICLQRA
jgi:hypothetical protein